MIELAVLFGYGSEPSPGSPERGGFSPDPGEAAVRAEAERYWRKETVPDETLIREPFPFHSPEYC